MNKGKAVGGRESGRDEEESACGKLGNRKEERESAEKRWEERARGIDMGKMEPI